MNTAQARLSRYRENKHVSAERERERESPGTPQWMIGSQVGTSRTPEEEDTSELQRQVSQLQEHIEQLHRDFEVEKRSYQNEMLKKVEAKLRSYRDQTEAEIEKYRAEARRAQERLKALQKTVQLEDLTGVGQGRSQNIADILLSVLLQLQEGSDPLDPDTLRNNVHTAVAKCLEKTLQHHEAELQALAEVHDETIQKLKQPDTPLPTSPSTAFLTQPDITMQQLLEVQHECNVAREDLEQERQRVAMVCIHMKASLQKKNAAFETAVMKKADDLVNAYKAKSEEAEEQVENLKEALVRQVASPVQDLSTQTDPEPAPRSYLANAVVAGYRRECGYDNVEYEATLQFEKDVMNKAQSLLQKYSSVVNKEREGSLPKPLPSSSPLGHSSCGSFNTESPLPRHIQGGAPHYRQTFMAQYP